MIILRFTNKLLRLDKMPVINIGVVGCGHRMREIIKLLLKVNPNYRVVSVYDPDTKSVRALQLELKYPISRCDSYAQLTENKNVNWVFIGSINSAHKEHITSAFKNNKNVFCEKPLVTSVEDCKEIKRMFDRSDLIFFVSYPLRYSPHYQKIKKIITHGGIGNVVSIEFNENLSFNHGSFIMSDWRRFEKFSGGHMLEKCCHDISLVNWISESLPKKVASFGGLDIFREEDSQFYNSVRNRGERLIFNNKAIPNPFLTEKDIVDNQVVIIEFYNKVKACFHTICSSGIPERRMYICGTRGTIRADLLTGRIEYRRAGSTKKIFEYRSIKEDNFHGGGDIALARELNKSILKNKAPLTSLVDAIKSAVVCLCIDESMKNECIIDITSIWKGLGYIDN